MEQKKTPIKRGARKTHHVVAMKLAELMKSTMRQRNEPVGMEWSHKFRMWKNINAGPSLDTFLRIWTEWPRRGVCPYQIFKAIFGQDAQVYLAAMVVGCLNDPETSQEVKAKLKKGKGRVVELAKEELERRK